MLNYVLGASAERRETIVRETWPITETIKNFNFFSGQQSIINKMAEKTKKYETTYNNQQRNIVKKTKRTSNQ